MRLWEEWRLVWEWWLLVSMVDGLDAAEKERGVPIGGGCGENGRYWDEASPRGFG